MYYIKLKKSYSLLSLKKKNNFFPNSSRKMIRKEKQKVLLPSSLPSFEQFRQPYNFSEGLGGELRVMLEKL
jgi:hypothetical protein